ncbi:ComF family protein [Candidatus Gracilibacteria bacterium]|nr:ComF family protein [Candidatus Gracilibacteria bacterium]
MQLFVDRLVNFLFPQRCVSCKREGTFFCLKCFGSLQQAIAKKDTIGDLQVHSLFQEYRDPCALQLTQLLKYNFCSAVEEVIETMLQKRTITIKRPAILVPIPLHPRRLAWRGFNQSRIIATMIAKQYEIELQDLLVRTHYVRPQVGLSKTARAENMLRAFDPRDRLQLDPTYTYYLIDDVITTGATMNSAAQTLRSVGALHLEGIAIVKAA